MKLFKASDVCELAQVQPYVLRSWEKDFPGIGVQKSADSTRLYRQSDVEQVLRIKQLVFGEGLTVSGARRRLDEAGPRPSDEADADAVDVLQTLGADVRTKIARVRDGLRAIHVLLSSGPRRTLGTTGAVDSRGDYELEAPRMKPSKGSGTHVAAPRAVATRGKAVTRAVATKKTAAPAKRGRVNM